MSSETSPPYMEWSLEEFDIQPSLWKLVEEIVAEAERPDIKQVIGEDLVDETVELHEEALSLLEIWQDYRNETDKTEKNFVLNPHLKNLPEPPMMRDNLRREIEMFVEMLQQKMDAEGSQVSKILNQKDASIVDYVLDKRCSPSQSERPSTASSRPSSSLSSHDGRQTPLRATPRSDASSSASSTGMSDQLESMNDNLNALEIDRIAEHLRGLFTDEKKRLTDDTGFLQGCLLEESDYRQQVLTTPDPEPSLKDLRELGTKLEKELLNTGKISSPSNPKASKLAVLKQSSNSLENDRKRSLPSKPNLPTTSPELQTRTFAGSSASLHRQKFSPSPPGSANTCKSMLPSPPSSAKPHVQRPSSASRFRRMVVECRDATQ